MKRPFSTLGSSRLCHPLTLCLVLIWTHTFVVAQDNQSSSDYLGHYDLGYYEVDSEDRTNDDCVGGGLRRDGDSPCDDYAPKPGMIVAVTFVGFVWMCGMCCIGSIITLETIPWASDGYTVGSEAEDDTIASTDVEDSTFDKQTESDVTQQFDATACSDSMSVTEHDN